MLALLRELIPGAQAWPRFLRNRSEQFEARLSLVEILASPSVLLHGMQGSVLPIAVSHGEGRAAFATDVYQQRCVEGGLVACRYSDGRGNAARLYPANPNGTPAGIAAHNSIASLDGKFAYLGTETNFFVFRTSDDSLVHHVPNVGESGVFPFTVDSRNRYAYVCLGKHVGFDVVDLKKGAVAKVETGRSAAALQWCLTPKVLRALYIAATESSRPKTSRK